ncbi:MAG: glycosyltransferase family 2 protein [Candidatus Omnitrophica bacterium]|nr:glycosyltransferase family 2 protein [Candidatus Omnitrophota bacterium]
MSYNNLVSVIIAVLNGEKYILGAIESVLNQTFKNFEIIVVDDGSTDGTKKVLEPMIQQGIIRYIYQENKGLANARNTGIANSNGRFLKFLDCDDFLYPKQLELQIEHLNNKSDLTVSVTDFELEFESKSKKTVKIFLSSKNQLDRFIESNPCPVHTILISKKQVQEVDGFSEEMISQEDTDLWLRILLNGGVFEKIDYVGCCYRILHKSQSSNSERMFKAHCVLSERINKHLSLILDQLNNYTLEQILKVNCKFIHSFFVKRLSPRKYVPITLELSKRIYVMKPDNLRKFLLTMIGIQNITYMQYLKRIATEPNYLLELQSAETSWRDENNYA